MTSGDLAARIAAAASLRGEFRLRSGTVSDRYFDKYRFEADPSLLREVAAEMARLLPAAVDALAGLELGGVPLATAVSLHTGLPCVFVRKVAKDYGTCQLAEGGAVDGRRLVIVEDVVTSGGQIVASVAELRALGALVDVAVCAIDREAGGYEALAAIGVELRSVFAAEDPDRLRPTSDVQLGAAADESSPSRAARRERGDEASSR